MVKAAVEKSARRKREKREIHVSQIRESVWVYAYECGWYDPLQCVFMLETLTGNEQQHVNNTHQIRRYRLCLCVIYMNRYSWARKNRLQFLLGESEGEREREREKSKWKSSHFSVAVGWYALLSSFMAFTNPNKYERRSACEQYNHPNGRNWRQRNLQKSLVAIEWHWII